MGEYDDDDIDVESENDSNLVKDLRKQLKAAKKASEETQARLAEFEAQARKASVADVLKSRGARPEIAKFYNNDDTSPDAVNAWLTENAELFGVDTSDDGIDEETAEAVERVERASAKAKPRNNTLDAINDRIRNASSREELHAAQAELAKYRQAA